MNTSECNDSNVSQSVQLVENQVEAAFISLHVGLPLRLTVLIPMC